MIQRTWHEDEGPKTTKEFADFWDRVLHRGVVVLARSFRRASAAVEGAPGLVIRHARNRPLPWTRDAEDEDQDGP